MNTAQYLLQDSDDTRLALVAEEGEHTYGRLKRIVSYVVYLLQSYGIVPGSRVGILGSNSAFTVVCYLAALQMGAVAVPLSTALPAATIANLVGLADCTVVFTENRFAKVAGCLPGNVRVLWDTLLDEADAWEAQPPKYYHSSPGDLASLMFTSGSTAMPKAVMITHRNIQANTQSIISAMEIARDDRMMVILPLYYCFGTSLLHTHLRAGATLVLNNSFAFPETAVDMMEAEDCTSLAGVPFIFATLLRNTTFARRRMSSLTKVQVAGGALAPAVLADLHSAQPQARIFLMYGQTEATARLSYLPPSMMEAKPGSIGKGVPGVNLHVVRPDGEDVLPGEQGEIVARGENISPGYLGDPVATAEKIRNGALWTGDLATMDADGYIFITGRKSEFAKPYGIRVSTRQIVDCAYELPDVVAAWTDSVPDPNTGEAITLSVTLNPTSQLRPEEIVRHCKMRLPSYMVPRSVKIEAEAPLNGYKISKAVLSGPTASEVGAEKVALPN